MEKNISTTEEITVEEKNEINIETSLAVIEDENQDDSEVNLEIPNLEIPEEEFKINEFRNEMFKNLISAKQKAEENNNQKVVDRINSLLKQMKDAEDLNFLKIKKTSDSKFKKVSKEEFNKAKKITRGKLRSNKTFQFRDINDLNKILSENLGEEYSEYSKEFLYRFYYYINENRLNNIAITVSQVINNIASLEKEDSFYRLEWLNNVKSIIDNILGREKIET
jgi:hypothetical protein